MTSLSTLSGLRQDFDGFRNGYLDLLGPNGLLIAPRLSKKNGPRVSLRDTNGRVGGPDGAAAPMGLKRTTLITRMKKLGIEAPQFSQSFVRTRGGPHEHF